MFIATIFGPSEPARLVIAELSEASSQVFELEIEGLRWDVKAEDWRSAIEQPGTWVPLARAYQPYQYKLAVVGKVGPEYRVLANTLIQQRLNELDRAYAERRTV